MAVVEIFARRFLAPQSEEGGDGGGAAVADPASAAPESEYLTEEPQWSREAWEDDGGPAASAEKTEDTAGAGAAAESGEHPGSGIGKSDGNASTPAPAALDPRLYQFGEQHLGLTRKEVDAIGQDGMLRAAQRFLARQQAQPQTQPTGQQPPAKTEDGKEKPEFEDIVLGEEFEPEIRDALSKMNARQRAQHEEITRLTGLLSESQKHHQAQLEAQQRAAAEEWNQNFDAALDARDEELYGRGRFDSLKTSNEKAARNRADLARMCGKIEQFHRERGEAPPALEKLVEQAERALFGDRIKQQTLQEVAEKSKRQRGGSPAKPTHKEPLRKSADQRAVEKINEFYRSRGEPVDDEDSLLE